MGKKILILYFVSVLLGILTGAIASLFQLTIQQMDHLLELLFHMTESYGLPVGIVSAMTSMVMLFIAWMMVKYIAPEAAGSGVQEIEGTLLHVRPIFWKRLIPVKFLGVCYPYRQKWLWEEKGLLFRWVVTLDRCLESCFGLHAVAVIL